MGGFAIGDVEVLACEPDNHEVVRLRGHAARAKTVYGADPKAVAHAAYICKAAERVVVCDEKVAGLLIALAAVGLDHVEAANKRLERV